jgi:hypothetical protein
MTPDTQWRNSREYMEEETWKWQGQLEPGLAASSSKLCWPYLRFGDTSVGYPGNTLASFLDR